MAPGPPSKEKAMIELIPKLMMIVFALLAFLCAVEVVVTTIEGKIINKFRGSDANLHDR